MWPEAWAHTGVNFPVVKDWDSAETDPRPNETRMPATTEVEGKNQPSCNFIGKSFTFVTTKNDIRSEYVLRLTGKKNTQNDTPQSRGLLSYKVCMQKIWPAVPPQAL